jgi:predicted dehydrogenase
MTLLPLLKSLKPNIKYISSAGGLNATSMAKKYNISNSTTDNHVILNDKDVDLIIITTRHNQHASLTIEALDKGKNVFIEKPLALNIEELDSIISSYKKSKGTLMVGFNRRFSPHSQKMKSLLGSGQINVIATMNAGFVPKESWIQDLKIGGGRIIGEACHFIDLLCFLAGSSINSIQVKKLSNKDDVAVIVLGFEDGSWGTIHYVANGSSQFPKERIEIFTAGRVLQLDNFRKLTAYGWPGFKKMAFWKQNKGQDACCKAFLEAIEQGKESPIPLNELIEVAQVTIKAARLLSHDE